MTVQSDYPIWRPQQRRRLFKVTRRKTIITQRTTKTSSHNETQPFQKYRAKTTIKTFAERELGGHDSVVVIVSTFCRETQYMRKVFVSNEAQRSTPHTTWWMSAAFGALCCDWGTTFLGGQLYTTTITTNELRLINGNRAHSHSHI